jgi:hypothetical protein
MELDKKIIDDSFQSRVVTNCSAADSWDKLSYDGLSIGSNRTQLPPFRWRCWCTALGQDVLQLFSLSRLEREFSDKPSCFHP